jgi:hypothetical protein
MTAPVNAAEASMLLRMHYRFEVIKAWHAKKISNERALMALWNKGFRDRYLDLNWSATK